MTISGRVTRAGKPIEGATLTGWAKWRGDDLAVGSFELTWNDDGVVLWRATRTTDADGRYRIGGLTPGPHRVQIEAGETAQVTVILRRR